MKRLPIIVAGTLSVTSAICAASIGGYALGHPDQAPVKQNLHSVKIAPVNADQAASSILSAVLPYYGKVAPAWCAEDMVCWIGSKADGRSPADIMASLPADIVSSSQAYADGTLIDKDGNEVQPATMWHEYTAGQVIVCPGAVVEMDSYGPGEDAAMPKGGQWAHCDGKALGE